MSKETLKSLDDLIEERIKIASTQTKCDDPVVHIAWLADGINLWYQTNGERGHSPAEARRYIISSTTRLIKDECKKLLDRVNTELIGEDKSELDPNDANISDYLFAIENSLNKLRANQRKILADMREGL